MQGKERVLLIKGMVFVWHTKRLMPEKREECLAFVQVALNHWIFMVLGRKAMDVNWNAFVLGAICCHDNHVKAGQFPIEIDFP